MRRARCPWCGKKINFRADGRRCRKKVTPRYLVFAKCGQCDRYYGQAVYASKYMRTMFWLLIPVVIATFVFEMPWLLIFHLLLSLPAVWWIPFCRMDEAERPIDTDSLPRYEAVFSGRGTLGKGQLCFLTDRFDEADALSVVSPLFIDSFDRKSGQTTWHFLYDHPQNQAYVAKRDFAVFDRHMNAAGEMSSVTRQTKT